MAIDGKGSDNLKSKKFSHMYIICNEISHADTLSPCDVFYLFCMTLNINEIQRSYSISG